MDPSSRTPEGEPNRCRVCGEPVRVEPSVPPGDAPCPRCGTLLWFEAAAVPIERPDRASVVPGPAEGTPPPSWPAYLVPGAAVRITDGPFEDFAAVVDRADERTGRVTVTLEIFGRPVLSDLECWQVAPA